MPSICGSRKNRKNRSSRKNRNSRKNRSNRRQYGGAAYISAPMSIHESLAGSSPSQMNIAQGKQYDSFHMNQHGGMGPYPSSVVDSLLPSDMAASARITPLNNDINEVKGLRDPNQMGGRRRMTRRNLRTARRIIRRNGRTLRRMVRRDRRMMRRATRRNARNSRRASRRASRSAKRNSRGRFMKMRGGAVQPPLDLAASSSAPGMLLDTASEARAVRGMNPEWTLAPNPNSFAPRV